MRSPNQRREKLSNVGLPKPLWEIKEDFISDAAEEEKYTQRKNKEMRSMSE